MMYLKILYDMSLEYYKEVKLVFILFNYANHQDIQKTRLILYFILSYKSALFIQEIPKTKDRRFYKDFLLFIKY
jgi:hypothetical protein